ncbi:hypothetical protein LZ30DRAFT_121670 [Colletotrichum cereale]|nr:hypothetical protein LZ30DRAFT_121670 [Colletotrichum cereale]
MAGVRRSYSGRMSRQNASTPQSGKWLRGLDCTTASPVALCLRVELQATRRRFVFFDQDAGWWLKHALHGSPPVAVDGESPNSSRPRQPSHRDRPRGVVYFVWSNARCSAEQRGYIERRRGARCGRRRGLGEWQAGVVVDIAAPIPRILRAM